MIALSIALLAAAAPAPAAQPPQLFGLVIGYNQSDDPSVAPLRYADDDAVKSARLLSDLGAEVVLLTELDVDSGQLFGAVDASRPTRTAIDAALLELGRRILLAKQAGRRTELLIFYSGHGDVKNNEGYIQLAGGRLYRRDFRELLLATSADQVHAIVDACKSYFLVFERGPGGERWKVNPEVLTDSEALPERVGLLLSTSSAQDSHEWEAFQSGVFSHEVRSALRGAADLDGDGRVSYEEAAAFVFGANRAIPNARYRPKFFVRTPSDATLIELRGRPGDRLISGPGISAHLFLEDARGNRVLDFHPDAGRRVELVIPTERPLFVREIGRLFEWVSEQSGSIELASLTERPIVVQPRGAEHVAFASLFSTPFDDGALTAYRDAKLSEETELTAEAPPPAWPRPALGIASLTLGLAGGVMTGLGVNARASVEDGTPQLERARINDRIDTFNVAAIVLYSLAGATAAGFLIWTLWPEEAPAITVIAEGTGLRIGF